jgi:hypothetical protein
MGIYDMAVMALAAASFAGAVGLFHDSIKYEDKL